MIAAALALAGARVSPLALHVAVVLLTTLHGAMVAVAATERGLMLAALGYIWTAVYVAFFFRAQAARRYAVLMIVGLGVALLAARAPTGVSVWLTLSAMVWAGRRDPHPAQRAAAGRGAHRQPHRPAQPHRLRRRRHARARDGRPPR